MMYNKRKKSPFFATDIVKSFDDIVPSGEQLSTFIELFSGEVELKKLDVIKNQIIYGRRGTGKSHFLNAFNQKINSQKNNNRFSLYISCEKIAPGTPENMDSYEQEQKFRHIASIYYKNFLNRFAQIIDEQWEMWETNQAIDKNGAKRVLYNEIINEIWWGSKYKYLQRTKSEISTSKKKQKGVSLSGKIGLDSVGLSVGGKLGSNKEKEEEEVTTIETYYHTDLSKIKDALERFLELMGIERLYICIDEWSELDKTCNTSIQQLFAEKLKLTFFKSKKISVKIASIWSLTEMSSKDLNGRFWGGIELGQDIYKELDLDILFFRKNDSIEKFLSTILYKRFLWNCSPETRTKFQRINTNAKSKNSLDDHKCKEFLIEQMFVKKENFMALVTASHGIPRDFLELLQRSLREIDDFEKYYISRDIVDTVAREFYLNEKRNRITDNRLLTSFIAKIDTYLEQKIERFFVIKSNDVKNSIEIKELVDKKFLHQLPSSLVDRRIRNKYKVFLIDYGCFQDWHKSRKKEYDDSYISPIVELTDTQIENIENYLLDIQDLPTTYLYCTDCNQIVPVNNPIYMKYKACPHCASENVVKNN